MSGFTQSVTKTYMFETDAVTVEFTRIKRRDWIKLLPMMPQPDERGVVTATPVQMLEITEAACAVLPKYIQRFEGLRDASGFAVPLEVALEETYFSSLLGDIVQDWLGANDVTEGQAKNSAAQLAAGTAESSCAESTPPAQSAES